MDAAQFAIAFCFGIIPALFWVWFWLREDSAHPEPFSLVVTAFFAGMIVVPIALVLEESAMKYYDGDMLIFVWVTIEEILKYAAALIVILWHKAVDEPIDAVIYMITIALGFSALENAFYAFDSVKNAEYLSTLITGNFRFLGATLLHVLASGTIGVMMALVYYKHSWLKVTVATLGLFIAIVLHALFNFSIIGASGDGVLHILMFVWIGIIVLFLLFEKIKLLEKKHRRPL